MPYRYWTWRESQLLVFGRKIFSSPVKSKYYESREIDPLWSQGSAATLHLSKPTRVCLQNQPSNHKRRWCPGPKKHFWDTRRIKGTVLFNETDGTLDGAVLRPDFHQPWSSTAGNSTSQEHKTVSQRGRPTYLVLETHLTPGGRGQWPGFRSASCRRGHRPSESRWSCRTSAWARGSLRCPGRSWCSGILCHTAPGSESGVAGPLHPLFPLRRSADAFRRDRPQCWHVSRCHLKTSEETTNTVIIRKCCL